MQTPLQITFRNLDASPAVEATIRERVAGLDQLFDRVTSCHVIIQAPDGDHRTATGYHVHIDLTVPGRQIVVKRDPPKRRAREDIHVSVRHCFDAAQRQLEDYVRRQRGDIKTHEIPTHGRIGALFAEKDYGFIQTPGDEQIYFHRNAVAAEGFGRLVVGDEVRFTVHAGEGEKGPQASSVIPIGKHHLSPERP